MSEAPWLDLNAEPIAECSACHRQTWEPDAVNEPCGMPQPDGTVCPGTFRAEPAGEGQTISCRQCGTTGSVQWWLVQITGTDRLEPVPAAELPALLLRHMGIRIDPATIRQWVKRGVIEPVKNGFAIRTTEDGAYLYDPHDVMTRLAKRERIEA